jgi:hypothetical protein
LSIVRYSKEHDVSETGSVSYVRFEVLTAVTMKNAVFWDVAPCRYFVNRRFGGTYRLHFQGIRNPRAMNQREQVAVASVL